MRIEFVAFILLAVLGAASLAAQRDRIRLGPRRSTAVTASQASELTLTTTEVAVRPIQVWVRTAGVLDPSGRVLRGVVAGEDAGHVKVGQRVRAFSPASRSRMYQATVAQVAPQPAGVTITAALAGQTFDASRHYVLEIVTDRGDFLSVPNEAILESGGKPFVYIQQPDGTYAPLDIAVGVRGELFTQVLEGLQPGQLVVTIGSFFIDAEHKLKGS